MGRTQFSIRVLLVITAAVAASLNVAVPPSSLAKMVALEALAVLFASISTTLALASPGALCGFWIGVSICAGLAAMLATVNLPLLVMVAKDEASRAVCDFGMAELTQSWVVPALWCLAPVNGLLCVFVRWLASPRQAATDHAGENRLSK